jgi:hypothetical protein
VVLPPLVLGYDELYHDSDSKETPKTTEAKESTSSINEPIHNKTDSLLSGDKLNGTDDEKENYSADILFEKNNKARIRLRERNESKVNNTDGVLSPMFIVSEKQDVPSLGWNSISVRGTENQEYDGRMGQPVPFVGGLILPNDIAPCPCRNKHLQDPKPTPKNKI